MSRVHHDRIPSESEMLLHSSKSGSGRVSVNGGPMAILVIAIILLVAINGVISSTIYPDSSSCAEKCNSRVQSTMMAVSIVAIIALAVLIAMLMVIPSSFAGKRRFVTLFVFVAVTGTIGALSAMIAHQRGSDTCNECQSYQIQRFNVIGMTIGGLLLIVLGILFVRPYIFVS